MFSRCSLDVLRMFAGFFQDVFRMLRWVLWAWWNLMIILNESMDINALKFGVCVGEELTIASM